MGEPPTRRKILRATAGAIITSTLAGCQDSIPELGTDTPTVSSESDSDDDRTDSSTTQSEGDADSGYSTPAQSESEDDIGYFSREGLENGIRGEVNEFRTSHGEDALGWDDLYRKPVRRHSEAMAATGELRTTVRGESASDRVYEASNCNPTVLIGRLDEIESWSTAAERLVRRWARSERTREKLLDPISREMAVGAATGTDDAYVYVTAALC